jgi:hypothetical protein
MTTSGAGSGFGFLLLLGIGILVLIAVLSPAVNSLDVQTYDKPAPPVVVKPVDTRAGQKVISDGAEIEYQAHAESHGAEANFSRDCFEKYGSIMLFKMGDKSYARMCVLEDGYVALQFLVWVAEKKYVEASSYIPHLVDSSINGVKEWLLRAGWTNFHGPLP